MDLANTATSDQATQQYVNQARAQGQALQNQYNAQSSQLQGQYGQDVNQANQAYGNSTNAQQNLANFNSNLPSEYKNLTNQYATGAGYNANTMANSMNNAMTLSEVNANLPKSVNQMGNYSGATSGQIAQNYANLAPNIAQATAGANTMLANQQQAYAQGIGAAQNITNQQGTNFGNLLTGANQQYSNAVNQMQAAGQTMSSIENLQQQQGYVTAQQVTAYQNARSQYIQQRAAATQAYAQAAQLNTQTEQMRNYMNSAVYKQNMVAGKAYNPITGQWSGGSNTNAPQFAKYSPGTGGRPATLAQLQDWSKKIMTGSTVKGPTGLASLLNPGASNWFNLMSRPEAYDPTFNNANSGNILSGLLGI